MQNALSKAALIYHSVYARGKRGTEFYDRGKNPSMRQNNFCSRNLKFSLKSKKVDDEPIKCDIIDKDQ